MPLVLQKRIQVITNCSCQSCDKVRTEDCAINDTNTQELPLHLYVDPDNANKGNDDYIHPGRCGGSADIFTKHWWLNNFQIYTKHKTHISNILRTTLN